MLHELLKQVGAIRKGLIKLINQLVHWIATADVNMINIVVFHFVRSIEVLATFDLIYDYISSSKLIQILNGDIQARAWDLINKRPAWKRIATHDQVQ